MRPHGRPIDLIVLTLGALVIAVLAAASVVLAPGDLGQREEGSSFGANPRGAKAAFLLLDRLGHAPRRSFEPIASLDVAAPPTILLIEPVRGASDLDRAALTALIERGATVLAAGPAAAVFLPGISRGASVGWPELRRYTAATPSPLTAAGAIELMSSPVRLTLGAEWVHVYGTADDPGVLTARFGDGRVTWWISSRPLTNEAIASGAHLDLFLRALGPAGAPVLWDEYYHGHARSFWSYVARTPLIWGCAQVGVMLALAGFTFSRRRGPVRSRGILPRTSPIEFITTMGTLYERAREAGAAVAAARSRLRRLLLARTGLPATVPDPRLVRAAAERCDVRAADLAQLLETSGAAAGDADLTERAALQLVARIQRMAGRIAGVGHHAGVRAAGSAAGTEAVARVPAVPDRDSGGGTGE